MGATLQKRPVAWGTLIATGTSIVAGARSLRITQALASFPQPRHGKISSGVAHSLAATAQFAPATPRLAMGVIASNAPHRAPRMMRLGVAHSVATLLTD
ncbi:MAG: hypothetical protein H7338_04320 [Candidatus Sericytochromatia bacterium]|nr:hypothetical protein [Candidatus Sericytochromatia bacterium]